LVASLALLAAACGDEESPPAAEPTAESAAAASGEPGPAESNEITVALPFPDAKLFGPYVVASDLGYFEEEGLKVKTITADNVNAAVASGSADIGVQDAGGAIDAIREGLPVTILAGSLCQQPFNFAVQPDVKSVQDLAGTDVTLAGTPGDPSEVARKRVLKEEGWDLDAVDVNLVYPGPDSATWREFFIADRIALMPFFQDDLRALQKDGANIIIESLRPWPNAVHIANKGWLEDNPNGAVRFLRAMMKSIDYIVAPAIGEPAENRDRLLEILEANDFDVADMEATDPENPWIFGSNSLCPNLYYDEAAWNDTIDTNGLDPLAFDVDLSYLERAQRLLDRDNAPPKEVQYP
jgi:NitT/TauT family transport system substrate-binding protein